MPKISIVASYHNRISQLQITLHSICRSVIKDIEFIAVDDGSDDNQRPDVLRDEFPFLKTIRIEPKDKWYVNPCVPFNIGFKAATGDIVVIQNPECFHCGDILSHISNNLKPGDYTTYACYSANVHQSQAILKYVDTDSETLHKDVLKFLEPLVQHDRCGQSQTCWYNHSRWRTCFFHFCTALHKEDLDDLGGFDERYAEGIGFDDNDIVIRAQRKGMKLSIVDDPLVIHLWHYLPGSYMHRTPSPNVAPLKRNRELFHNITMKEKTWRANT